MGKTILLIDDDALVLKSIQNLLKNEGYSVLVAKNTNEAESIIIQMVPDLILCDIRMPKEDGIEFMKRLRSQLKVDQVPIIFMTGYASEEAPIDAIKLGAKDYILKPFDMEELLDSVKKHIQIGE